MRIPFLGRIMRSKKKKEIEKSIKELIKQEAQLKSELETLQDMGRDTSDVKEEIKKIDKTLSDKYNDLANFEYRKALSELGEEAEEKKITLARMKGELKEQKKEKSKLEERLKETQRKVNNLKEEKKELAKKINELEKKLRDSRMKLDQKEGIIKEFKEEKIPEEKIQLVKEPEEKVTREKFFKTVIDKYSGYIDGEEKKTIQEMKSLIQPNNINLREYLEGIEAEEPLKACEKSYEKIMDEIKSCKPLQMNYWMNIKSMLDNKVADYKDKAILVCSAFRHLGEKAYVAMVRLDNGERRPLVELKVNDKILLIDPNRKHPFKKHYGDRKELKEQYKHEGSKIKGFEYIFNDREYITMEET